jgi:hypothetical protein
MDMTDVTDPILRVRRGTPQDRLPESYVGPAHRGRRRLHHPARSRPGAGIGDEGGGDIYADSGVHRRQWITRSGRRRSVPKRPHPDAVFGPPAHAPTARTHRLGRHARPAPGRRGQRPAGLPQAPIGQQKGVDSMSPRAFRMLAVASAPSAAFRETQPRSGLRQVGRSCR